jgi:hypothetical protein
MDFEITLDNEVAYWTSSSSITGQEAQANVGPCYTLVRRVCTLAANLWLKVMQHKIDLRLLSFIFVRRSMGGQPSKASKCKLPVYPFDYPHF